MVRGLRRFSSIATALSSNPQKPCTRSAYFHRFYSAEPQADDPSPPNPEEFDAASDAVFDSSHFDVLNQDYSGGNSSDTSNEKSTWDAKYRDRVNSKVFGEDISHFRVLQREEEKKKKAGRRASEFLEAALDEELGKDAEVREIKEEDQKSLAVGIIGAPNAGKSSLTNFMVCALLFSSFLSLPCAQ